MNPTSDAFDVLDENLKLDPDEREHAQTIHDEITELLKAAGVIIYAFLQGSFARKTMIAPLRDVDKIVVLHPDLAGLTPDAVMDRIQAVIAEKYPLVVFLRSRHALQVDFGANSFYFDTVPAWESDGDDDDVMIGNRDTGEWDRSNTRELIRVISARNGETNGLFIHQVRMGKQIIKNLLDGCIPGLHIESWAYLAITEAMAHDLAVAAILETGAALLNASYTEPTGREVISERLKPTIKAQASPTIAMAAADAASACRLAADGKHFEAMQIWHRLFGDCFPVPTMQDDRTALRNSFAGGGVAASGIVTLARTVPRTIPTRSWRP